MTAVAYDEIDALALAGGRYGKIDLACPLCGPRCKRPINRKRKVLRVWRDDDDFARYYCARCGAHGYSRDDKATKADPSEYLRRRAEAERRDAEDEQKRKLRARDIWRQAEPIAGTLAAQYLINRSIDIGALPDEMEHVLRWHSRCPWEDSTAPCMLALWSDAVTAAPKAIHRTALTAMAERIDRMSLAPTAGCVIRLWPDESVTQGLVIGEGIETTLAAGTVLRMRPAWAAGNTHNMARFPVLSGVTLTLLVDNDAEGIAAANECRRNWQAVGRDVERLKPSRDGQDFNDVILQRRRVPA